MAAVFFRTYKLSTHAHFQSDESRDLVNIHQIFVERKLTLVGPISEDNSHLFSSLTYYMLLPFAALWNFYPTGTVAGAVFWGLATMAILWLLTARINPKMGLVGGVLAAIWWPLVEISRWPWNPNMLIGWMSLSIYLQTYSKWYWQIASGLTGGLAIHHHFLAFIGNGLVWLKNRSIWWILGIIAAISPFVIFDLKNPPGLFLSKIFWYNGSKSLPDVEQWAGLYSNGLAFTLENLIPGKMFGLLGLTGIIVLIVSDLVHKRIKIMWFLSGLLYLCVLVVFGNQIQYIFPVIPLWWVWLFSKRKRWEHVVIMLIVGIILVSSLSTFSNKLSKEDYKGNLELVEGAAEIVKNEVVAQELKAANLAVLGSPEEERTGRRYREVLLTWDIRLMRADQYIDSKDLFVVTTLEENNLAGDGAAEIDRFRNGIVSGKWNIEGIENWKVIQFKLSE